MVFSAALELASSDSVDMVESRSVPDRVDLVLLAEGGGGLALELASSDRGGLALELASSDSINMVESRSVPDTVDLVLLAEGGGGLGS